jgi:hypothetical protein
MGLLDDAIREHLELKLRRGAEPAEIARVEREALEPVAETPGAFGEESDELPAVFDADNEPAVEDHARDGQEPTFEQAHWADLAEKHEPAALQAASDYDADASAAGQETAELDMQVVLDEDADTVARPLAAPVRGHSKLAPSAGALYSHQEEPLEWEAPATGATETPHGAHAEHASIDHRGECSDVHQQLVDQQGSEHWPAGIDASDAERGDSLADDAVHERFSFE